jgi:hypothetical protein
MKKSGILIILAVSLLAFNAADVVSTWIAISSGRGMEANRFILQLGGPFTPIALLLKLVIIPGAILGFAWWLAYRWKAPEVAAATILVPAAMYAGLVANNIMVAAKKVEKVAKKVKKTVVERKSDSSVPGV